MTVKVWPERFRDRGNKARTKHPSMTAAGPRCLKRLMDHDRNGVLISESLISAVRTIWVKPFFVSEGNFMKWVTRDKAKVDRIACPWLINRFVDHEAVFLFVPAEKIQEVAKREDATPFDVAGAELGHHDDRCSFDAVLEKYGLTDPALLEMATIVRGADIVTDTPPPESAGLAALAVGFRFVAKDDFDNMRLQFPAYDAWYAYCKAKVANRN